MPSHWKLIQSHDARSQKTTTAQTAVETAVARMATTEPCRWSDEHEHGREEEKGAGTGGMARHRFKIQQKNMELEECLLCEDR